jgi:hypothetical protein
MLITCPECQTKYNLRPGSTASKVRCRKCQAMITVPTRAGVGKTATRKISQTKIPTRPTPTTKTARKAEPAPAEEAPDAYVGTTIGGYEIVRKLGEGGMGAVYEARQVSLDRSVALKILPRNLASNTGFITRFKRESMAAAKLNHTNIVQVYDVGQEQGTYFFAMEFVEGKTLHDIMVEEGRLDPSTAAGYIIQAARGLEYAHRKNLIHRDIKPENIMVNEEGVAKVADLGLARHMTEEQFSVTATGAAIGTPYYMAPEQASDAKRVDHRADIYSLGCTLYELVTGRPPYDGASAYEILTKHKKEPLTYPEAINPQVSKELSAIVRKMMAKQKEDRFQSLREVIRALEEFIGVSDSTAGYQPQTYQVTTLQGHVLRFEAIQKNRAAKVTFLAIAAIVAVLALLSPQIGARFAVGLAGYVLLAFFFYFLFSGMDRKTYLYRRFRAFIFSSSFSDWLVMAVILGVAVTMIVVLGLLGTAVLALVLAAGTAGMYYAGAKRRLLGSLDEVIDDMRELLKEIRKKGVAEDDIQLFILKYGGTFNELICEQLFGYENMMETIAKRRKGERGKRGLGTRAREWLIDWLGYQEKKRPFSRGFFNVVFGAKGRQMAGAILILSAALAAKGIAFENEVFDFMRSYQYEYVLFSVALFISGFASSSSARLCLYGTLPLSEPLGIYGWRVNEFLANRFDFLDTTRLSSFVISILTKVPLFDEESLQVFEDNVTPLRIAATLLFIISFVAPVIFKERS